MCLFFWGPQKRAVKAENHVLKLKQEINLLQVSKEKGLAVIHVSSGREKIV